MPYYGKRRKVPKKGAKTATKRVYKKGKTSYNLNLESKIKNTVKRAMARNVEVKNTAEQTVLDQYIYTRMNDATNNFTIFPLNTVFNLITQSVGQGGRIGNKITLKRFTVAYCIKSLPQGWSDTVQDTYPTFPPQPMYVDCFILKRRDGTIETDVALASLYQFGSQVKGPTTLIQDHMLYVNKDVYVVLYHRRHKLVPVDNLDLDPTLETLTSSNDSNVSVLRKVSLTKYIKKNLRYNDGVNQIEDEPSTNIFMVCLPVGRHSAGPIYVDAGDPPATSSRSLPISISVNCMMQYTDA